MLKTRVISGLIGLALLIGVLYLGPVVIGIIISLIAAIGLYEFYNSISKVRVNPIKIAGYLSIIPLLLLSIKSMNLFTVDFNYVIGITLFVIIFICMATIVFKHKSYNIVDVCATLFGTAYVPFLLSFIILIRNMDNGGILIWLIFIGAWGTDTMAYICGRLFGKRKIIPEISPKKTLAGTIGGILGCILLMCIYGFIVNDFYGLKMAFSGLILLGLLCGVVSQIGDWAASAIKRYVNIKDFGYIMPGHGGVLDRFDSILAVAPIIYFILNLVK
jgi:phosphatidate cytidylyltransferase